MMSHTSMKESPRPDFEIINTPEISRQLKKWLSFLISANEYFYVRSQFDAKNVADTDFPSGHEDQLFAPKELFENTLRFLEAVYTYIEEYGEMPVAWEQLNLRTVGQKFKIFIPHEGDDWIDPEDVTGGLQQKYAGASRSVEVKGVHFAVVTTSRPDQVIPIHQVLKPFMDFNIVAE